MAVARPQYRDRVQEITQTTGTADLVLLGAKVGFQSFASAFTSGDLVYYTVENGVEWEVGLGTFTAAPDTLARDTVLDSSSSGGKVSLPAGDKSVFVTIPAIRAQRQLVSGETLLGVIDGVNTVFTTPEKFVRDTTYREMVYLRGLRRSEGVGGDYIASESGGLGTGYDTITFDDAPEVGDVLVIDYHVA